jgi:hypothetical protein
MRSMNALLTLAHGWLVLVTAARRLLKSETMHD